MCVKRNIIRLCSGKVKIRLISIWRGRMRKRRKEGWEWGVEIYCWTQNHRRITSMWLPIPMPYKHGRTSTSLNWGGSFLLLGRLLLLLLLLCWLLDLYFNLGSHLGWNQNRSTIYIWFYPAPSIPSFQETSYRHTHPLQVHVNQQTHKNTGRFTRYNRPYSHKLLTINNYVNCLSNFAFARSIYLFHRQFLRKSLCEYGLYAIAFDFNSESEH